MIYYAILGILSIAAVIPARDGDRRFNLFLFAGLALALLLFAGFRYYTGFDYLNYLNIYRSQFSRWVVWTIEPVPRLLMNFSAWTGIGYAGFLFIMAFFSVGLKSAFLARWSVLPVLSLLLYFSRTFLLADFGQIRQGLALAVVLFAWPLILKGELKKFIFLILAATLIHISAIFFLLVYWFARRRFSVPQMLLMVALAIPFAFIDFKTIFLDALAPVLPPFVSTKLAYYTATESDTRLGLTFSMILRVGILLICVLLQRDDFFENDEKRSVLNIYLFGVLFYIAFNSFPQIGNRGSFYFQQFELLLIPLILVHFKDHINRAIFFLFIVVYCYWGVNTVISLQPDTFVPYQSLLIKEII